MELFFISLAIIIVTNLTVIYWLDIKWMNLVSATGVEAKQIMSDYLRIITYIQNPFSQELKFQFFHYSPSGISHFRDVKHLFVLNEIITLITGGIFVINWRRMRVRKASWQLLMPIKVFILSTLVLLTLILVNFETWFIDFHHLFFTNQDWSFNPDKDPIILALPLSFFMQSFLLVVISILIMNGWVYIRGKQDLKN
ncbi:TIGR01906 family membrane protein [Lactobacillaceae bacterium Scapto_B20]